jgi:hypothetical protein
VVRAGFIIQRILHKLEARNAYRIKRHMIGGGRCCGSLP